MADNENIPVIDFTVSPGSTQGAPVDPTLSIEGMAADAKATGDAIAAVDDRIGGDLPSGYSDVADAIEKLTAATGDVVRSVNGEGPDADGDVTVRRVDLAGNLEADDMQESRGTFTARTAGGAASIADGDADLVTVYGRSVRTGAVQEVLTVTVTMVEGQTRPDQVTATIDRAIFIARASGSETITLTYGTAWSADPAIYGVTVSGTPFAGDQITIVYVAEDLGLFVNAEPETFVATGWNLYDHGSGYARVAAYGGSYRVDGTYTTLSFSATEDGTRTAVSVTDHLFSVTANGYIWVTGGNNTDTAIYPVWTDWASGTDETFAAYSEQEIDLGDAMEAFPYGLCQIGLVRDELRVDVGRAISRIDRMENTPENLAAAEATGRAYQVDHSYIYIVRAEPVVTEVETDGNFTASDHGMEWFTGSDIDVPAYLLYGQNLKDKLRSDVLTVSAQTLETAQKTQVRTNIGAAAAGDLSTLETTVGTLSTTVGTLETSVSDKVSKTNDLVNGFTETGTGKALDARAGKTLNDSLAGLAEDVVTLSAQTLTDAQKTQVRTNIGAADAAGLSAAQESIAIVADGNTHAAITSGQYVYVRGHGTLSEGLYKASTAIAEDATLTSSNLTAVSSGIGGEVAALNSKIATSDVSGSITVTSTTGDISQKTAYRTGNVVSLAFVLTLTKTVSSAALGCSATFTSSALKPINRQPGGTNDVNVLGLNINPSTTGADLNARTNVSKSSGAAIWLTYTYICVG